MTHQELINALTHLGFKGGWVITGEQITVWDNTEAKPTAAQLKAAAAAYATAQAAKAAEEAAAKAALLTRLGITADEAKLLLS